MKYNTLLKLALKEAAKGNHKQKMGAIIYKNGKIISRGYNKVNRGYSTYNQKYWQGSLHAEISAILNAKDKSLKGASIFVARQNQRLAMPCSKCKTIIKEVGIKFIGFTDKSPKDILWEPEFGGEMVNVRGNKI